MLVMVLDISQVWDNVVIIDRIGVFSDVIVCFHADSLIVEIRSVFS